MSHLRDKQAPNNGTLTKSKVDAEQASEAASANAQHPSQEKTEIALAKASQTLQEQAQTHTTRQAHSDFELLKHEYERKTEECESLMRTVDELNARVETLRNDFSAQSADDHLELLTLQSLLEKSREETEKLLGNVEHQKRSNRTLKSQNLRLQYQLNLWGIPVAVDAEKVRVPNGKEEDGRVFFPQLSALIEGLDPIPVVLRGDICTFGFPNLLSFLANSNLTGVLTTVSQGVIAKLYIEKGILRLTGWNHKDEELSLATLLKRSQLVSAEILDRCKEKQLCDLEIAIMLLQEEELHTNLIQSGLREHARVVLAYLFHLDQGAFFFQPGILRRQRYLQFHLPILDSLLVTAAEVDEKSRSEVEALTEEKLVEAVDDEEKGTEGETDKEGHSDKDDRTGE